MTNVNKHDGEWDSLRNAWLPPAEAPENQDWIVAAITGEKRRERIQLATDSALGVCCAGLLLFCASIAAKGQQAWFVAFALITLSIGPSLHCLRRRSWRNLGASVAAHRAALRRQVLLALLLARVGPLSGIAGLVIGIGLAQLGGLQRDFDWGTAIALTLASLALSASWAWSLRERRRLNILLLELNTLDDDGV